MWLLVYLPAIYGYSSMFQDVTSLNINCFAILCWYANAVSLAGSCRLP